MKLEVKLKADQYTVDLFGGKLVENKPIHGDPPYSNLIYWAHVMAPEDGTFPMHPHEGIEILTFIFDGGLEHFDTATDKWTSLPADGVQHIKAGSGLEHSEKYWKGSRAFQLWFNPDFSKAKQKDPYYKDYQADAFEWKEVNGLEVKSYVGGDAPIQTDAPGVGANRYKMPKGDHELLANSDSIYSIYIMEGSLKLEGNEMPKDSFVKIEGVEKMSFSVSEDALLFVLESPLTLDY